MTMKLTASQLQALAQKTLQNWKSINVVQFKADEKVVLQHMVQVLKDELQKEVDLESEAKKMVDNLERTNPGQFERHKMYQMLKAKLAKEKKVIL